MDGRLSRNDSTTVLDSDKLTRRSSGKGTNMSSKSETTIICGWVKVDCERNSTFSMKYQNWGKYTIGTYIFYLHIIKMYCAVKSRKTYLCSSRTRQLIQAWPNCLCHNLQKEIKIWHAEGAHCLTIPQLSITVFETLSSGRSWSDFRKKIIIINQLSWR